MPNPQPNHVSIIRALESELIRLKNEYEAKVTPIRATIGTLRSVNKACEKCGGTGGSEYRIVAEADCEFHKCTACQGTGYKRG